MLIAIPTWLVHVSFDAQSDRRTLRVSETELNHLTQILNFNRLTYEVQREPDLLAAQIATLKGHVGDGHASTGKREDCPTCSPSARPGDQK